MYDLLNLQIADAASATSKPIFEVAEMTDSHILLIDLRLLQRVSIFQFPAYVISLLSGLDILGSRRIFFNGVQDKPYELLHINGKFSRISQRSENEFIANRMHDMLCAYPDLRPCKITSKKENITNINSEKEMCRFLSKYIRDNAIGKYAIFKVYGYSDNIILIVNEFERTKITNIDDIAWVTSILYETGYLENRSIFLRNSLSVIIELKHVKGKFQEIIYAEGESGIL